MSTPKRTVAIACQGGGSHTAFTAGVLSRLLQPDVLEHYDIIGLSGTSGGAICATIAWSALINGRPETAGDLLTSFWTDNAASLPAERLLNMSLLWASQWEDWLPRAQASPYTHGGSDWSSDLLRRTIDGTVDVAAGQARALELGADAPLLVLSAVDAVRGNFRAFSSRDGDICTDAILASAAIPNLFRSVHLEGGTYWDGLFSQNPPIRELHNLHPDEIWVIQVNPTTVSREPKTAAEITSRRNELAGNLSLFQELAHIEAIDKWLANGTITSPTLKHCVVRVVERRRTWRTMTWGAASKLNRDPAFIQELLALGREQAEEQIHGVAFEKAWRSGDLDQLLSHVAPDAEFDSTHPDAALAPTTDRDRIRQYVADVGLRVDNSRTRLCREHLEWQVRAGDRPGTRARVKVDLDTAGRARRVRITDDRPPIPAESTR
ncbi:patatin-like phospholipase family protein [Granulicoccus phenolivorans]|uniref:patatin-like phospholipase family protein n=1 Tax=Granulicoccus phenolivorans TaxID=266854 RepID=UPI00040E42A9|nr:patatin-like phospholipase family protein [Granulicoccus phenolivorans]